MAIIFFDGFESETTPPSNGWLLDGYAAGGITVTDSLSRTGNYSIYMYNETSWAPNYAATNEWSRIYRTLDTTSNILIFGFGFRYTCYYSGIGAYSSGFTTFGNSSGSGRKFKIGWDSDDYIILKDLSSGQIWNSDFKLGINTLYYIQVKIIANDNTNGYIELRLGNTPVILLDNIKTCNTGYTEMNYIYYECHTDLIGNGPTLRIWLDDIYVVNNDGLDNTDFLGVCSVLGAVPVSNGDRIDFNLVGTGAAYELLDEISANTSDYIYASVAGDRALFNMGTIQLPSDDILALQTRTYSSRSVSGYSNVKFKMVLRNEADDEQLSKEFIIPTSNLQNDFFVLEKNPFTDTTWTEDDINNVQVGVRLTSN